MKRIGFPILMVIMVFALVVSACSSAAPAAPTAAPKAAAPTAAPAPTATQAGAPAAAPTAAAPAKALPALKVGVAAPFSGAVAIYGERMTNGFNLVMDAANWTAGGRKIEVIKDDHAGDPALGVTVYKRLLPQVDVIIGPLFSGVAKAVWKLPEEAKKPAMNLMYSPVGKSWGAKYAFNGGSMTDASLMKTIADYMVKEKKEDKIALLNSNSAYGMEGTAEYINDLKALNVNLLAREVFAEGDKDFAGQIAKVKSSGATSVLISGYETEMGLLVKQIKELLPTIRLYGLAAMMAPTFAKAAGEKNVEGIYMSANFIASDPNPIVKNFRDKWVAKYKDEPTDISAIGWDTASNLKGILDSMGPVEFSTDKFIEALVKTKVEGVQGTYDFKTDRWEPIGGAVMGQWKEGKVQLIAGRK